jgi:hypothetical protein
MMEAHRRPLVDDIDLHDLLRYRARHSLGWKAAVRLKLRTLLACKPHLHPHNLKSGAAPMSAEVMPTWPEPRVEIAQLIVAYCAAEVGELCAGNQPTL